MQILQIALSLLDAATEVCGFSKNHQESETWWWKEQVDFAFYFTFVDLEKAFDSVPRKVLWWALRSLGCQELALPVIQGMYCNADDLVLITDTQEEYISQLKAWTTGMESKGVCVSMKNTNFLVSRVGHDVLKKFGKYPCTICSSGGNNNSIQYSQCMLWVHEKRNGITKWLWCD